MHTVFYQRSFHSLVIAFAFSVTIAPVTSFATSMKPPKEVRVGNIVKRIESEHILVQFKDNTPADVEDSILQSYGATKVESVGEGRLGSLHRVHVAPGQEEKLLTSLKKNPEVQFAELNELLPATRTSNDAMLANQWHLATISAPQAWDISVGSNSVTVAILDSGVDATHPDLASRITAGYNAYDGNTNTADIHGHGTAAAGSAVVDTNNSVGLASACWNCRIMPVRIAFLQNGSAVAYMSTIATGMQWAVDHGAKILNISYGGLSTSSAIANSAAYVQSKGGLVFGSAGNDGTLISTSLTSNILFISATNSSDQKTSWSNYGPIIALAAPGDSILTTNNGGGYANWSGTSFASPLAAGVAALVWSANPALTNSQVQSYLFQGADDLGAAGKDDNFGYGRINAARSVRLAMGTPAPSPAPAPTPTPAPDWITCANENGTCSFTGIRNVRYGANGTYATRSAVNGSIACTNAVFGDPIPGVVKSCQYSAATVVAPTPTPAPTPTWTFCANENGFCAFTGTAQVRYGANGIFNTKTATDGINCTNAVFGDPVYGVAKSCQVYK